MTFQPATIPPADVERIRRARWVRFSLNQVMAFVAAWNGGVDTAPIAKAFGCKPGSLRMLVGKLKQLGVTVRPAKGYVRAAKPSATGERKAAEPAPAERLLPGSAQALLDAITTALEGKDQVAMSSASLEAVSGVPRGSMSYYLRQLTERGLIVAQSQGKGRQTLYARPGHTPRSIMVSQGSAKPEGFWTEERVALAKRLYLAEGKSGSEAARQVGCSRVALIAKANRMGWVRDPLLATLNRRANGRRMAAANRPAPKPRRPDRPPVPKPEVGKLRTIPLTCEPKPLAVLESCMCRWPVSGEGVDTLFCSALKESWDAPYCPGHMALAVNPNAKPAPKDLYDPSIRRTKRAA